MRRMKLAEVGSLELGEARLPATRMSALCHRFGKIPGALQLLYDAENRDPQILFNNGGTVFLPRGVRSHSTRRGFSRR